MRVLVVFLALVLLLLGVVVLFFVQSNPPNALNGREQKPTAQEIPPVPVPEPQTALQPQPFKAQPPLHKAALIDPLPDRRVASLKEFDLKSALEEPEPEVELPSPEQEELPKMIWSTDREGIKGAVQESLPEIIECYEAWSRAQPDLEGKIIVNFSISADEDKEKDIGHVTQAKLDESQLQHQMMEACLLDVMEELQFVAPEKELTVRYPFMFKSDH